MPVEEPSGGCDWWLQCWGPRVPRAQLSAVSPWPLAAPRGSEALCWHCLVGSWVQEASSGFALQGLCRPLPTPAL